VEGAVVKFEYREIQSLEIFRKAPSLSVQAARELLRRTFTLSINIPNTPTMIPSLRTRSPFLLRRAALRPYSTGVEHVSANDPKAAARTPAQNVSATNAVPTSSEGSFDKVLVESVEEAEKMRTLQAPNRKGIWSRSQQPREKAMVGPRFEQTIMEDQVRLSDASITLTMHFHVSCRAIELLRGGLGSVDIYRLISHTFSLDHSPQLSLSTNNPYGGGTSV
jgi:hypothetical protein